MRDSERKRRGVAGEQLAEKYLTSYGLQLIERNYHCRFGEIDLIMQDKEEIVFVEVRVRNHNQFGGALESITPTKIERILKSVAHYIATHNLPSSQNLRIDVVGIERSESPHPHIEWIKSAIEG